MPLTTSVLHDENVALLALEGELDLGVVGAVDAAVAGIVEDGFTLLVVDLGHLTFCDSSGLGALLRASRTLRTAGGTCVVAGARGPVERLLVLTSMDRVLGMSADVGAALDDLRTSADSTD